jgi:hypothetical protein
MASKQDLVVTQKRYVTKIQFNNESAAFNLGITASAFDPIDGLTDGRMTRGITNNTAALSSMIWNASGATFGYHLTWAGGTGATAMSLFGPNGNIALERATLKNNAVSPTGILTITPTGIVTGTVILEFVHSSGSLGTYLA